jgi:chromosomal replication initiation ATPase DnaA
MNRIENVLNYIQLYTGADKYTLKRIRSILEKEFEEKQKKIEVIEKSRVVYVKTKPGKPEISIEAFSDYISKEHEIDIQQIKRKCRKAEILRQRNKFVLFAVQYGFTFSEIGRFLKKDHSTIIHSFKNQQK